MMSLISLLVRIRKNTKYATCMLDAVVHVYGFYDCFVLSKTEQMCTTSLCWYFKFKCLCKLYFDKHDCLLIMNIHPVVFSVTHLTACWQFLTLITPLAQINMTSNSFALLLFNKPRVVLAKISQTKQRKLTQTRTWGKVRGH